MKIIAVYCGRFNPIHKGHEMVIQEMINKFGIENSLIILGSANAPFSLRHFFSYLERRNFIKTIFPEIKIVGLPDYDNNEMWLKALDDIIDAVVPNSDREVVFFGGCEEDIDYFINDGRDCQIINRFNGRTPKISATEVRDCLIYGRSLDDLINNIIIDEMRIIFRHKWERLKKI